MLDWNQFRLSHSCLVLWDDCFDFTSATKWLLVWYFTLLWLDILITWVLVIQRALLEKRLRRTNERFFLMPVMQSGTLWEEQSLNTLHPNISLHILRTVLYTFPKVSTRRICLTIKSFSGWWSFFLFSWHLFVIQGWYCKEKLDASHS